MEENKTAKESKKDEDILALAMKRFNISKLAFRQSRENSRVALDFRALDQWPDNVRTSREKDPDGARPCLTVDKLGQYVHQIVNDFRQQKTGIEVLPVDGGADIEVAEVYQDIIRRIENQSTASQAYNWAFQCTVEAGEGFWRVITAYETETSFTQEIFIKKIPDVFSVWFDPSADYTDGRDAEYVFIIDDMDRQAFEEQYGADAGEFSSGSEGVSSAWISEDRVRIAEYFYKEKIEVEIGIDASGIVSEINEQSDRSSFIKTRKTKKTIVKWCKLTSGKIIEKGEWPSKYLPIVRVVGDEHRIANEGIFYQGMIYPAVDAQRMVNYASSAFVEMVALAPKSPFVAASGQIENFREQWSQANQRNFSVLEYDPVTVNGTAAPPPMRMPMPGVPDGWGAVDASMTSNIQQAMGLYQSSLGQSSNERTGVAIDARKVQGEQSQFHFFDSAANAIEQTGRIIVDLIPKIYNAPKVMKIRGEDGVLKQVFINPEMAGVVRDKLNQYQEMIGREINPTIGSYDVVMAAGPSSATKRQETSKSMFLLAQTSPELVKIGGDIMVGAMDFPGSQELAQRIFRTIPPEITNPNPELPPEAQQLKQQNEMLMAENEKLKSGLVEKMEIAKVDSQTKLETTKMSEDAENLRTQAKLDTEKEIAMIQEAGKVKSAKLTSKGEVQEEFVKNIGSYKSLLIQQGYSPEMADKMLGSFANIMRGQLLAEVGVGEKPIIEEVEDKIEDENDDEFKINEFVENF